MFALLLFVWYVDDCNVGVVIIIRIKIIDYDVINWNYKIGCWYFENVFVVATATATGGWNYGFNVFCIIVCYDWYGYLHCCLLILMVDVVYYYGYCCCYCGYRL